MFSTGQLIFAVVSLIVFVIVIAYTYKRDKKWRQKNYKGVLNILISFVIFIFILFLIKYLVEI